MNQAEPSTKPRASDTATYIPLFAKVGRAHWPDCGPTPHAHYSCRGCDHEVWPNGASRDERGHQDDCIVAVARELWLACDAAHMALYYVEEPPRLVRGAEAMLRAAIGHILASVPQ